MDIAHEYLNSRSRQMLALLIETGDLQAIKFHLTKRDPDYKDKMVVEAPDQKSELEEHREKIKGFLDEIGGITESTTSAEAETITEPIS